MLSSDELKIINNSCVEEVLDVLLPDELLSNICDVKGDFDNSEFFDTYNTVDKMIEQFGKLPTDICRSYAKDAAASCWSVINKVKGRRRFETIPASDLIDFGIATKFKKVA